VQVAESDGQGEGHEDEDQFAGAALRFFFIVIFEKVVQICRRIAVVGRRNFASGAGLAQT
jgi:hypothetical protein